MLEKLAGNINAQKSRVILLLQAYFNAMHKEIFNDTLDLSIEIANAIPIEVIGE